VSTVPLRTSPLRCCRAQLSVLQLRLPASAALPTGDSAHPGNRKQQKRFWFPHNPLKRSSQLPLDLADGWYSASFADPTLPLHIDIGSDRGHFCMGMAACQPGTNFLGLEIRSKPVLEACLALSHAPQPLPNCCFLHANANCHWREITGQAAGVAIQTISLNFPDPWTKKKHHKRRVLQREFVPQLAASLAPGGRLVVQTDVLVLAEAMRATARACPLLQDSLTDPEDWMDCRPPPFEVLTEWEKQLVVGEGRQVFRFVMLRTLETAVAPEV